MSLERSVVRSVAGGEGAGDVNSVSILRTGSRVRKGKY